MSDKAKYTIPDDVTVEVLGHNAGDTFEADIPAEQEARLVARGQLAVSGGLGQLPREQLDAIAREHGIDPGHHPNKSSLVDAIKANENEE